MRQKQNSERQIKVTTKPFVTELRRIPQKFGGKSDYLYFCRRNGETRRRLSNSSELDCIRLARSLQRKLVIMTLETETMKVLVINASVTLRP